MDVEYGPLAPDQGEVGGGYLMVADGVQPLERGYGPFPSLNVSTTATALSGAPRGLFGYQTADGTWQIVGFTDSAVQIKLSDDTWSDIDTGLSTTAGDDWTYLRFGTKLLYSNTTQGLRAYDVEAGGAASAVAAAKAPRWIFECGNILFGLNCLDSAGNRNDRLIRSTAFSDHTNWTTKGADYQPLEGGGALIWGAKLSDTAAVVLQQSAVKLLQVGNTSNALWGIQTVSEGFGAVGPKSCVAFNGVAYWLATDGFRRWGLGMGEPERIGAGFIDQWFLARVDQTDLSLVQASIDPFRKNVLWAWKRSGPPTASNVFYDVIGYNWQFRKWFTLTIPAGLTYIGYSAQTAQTWDALAGDLTWDMFDVVWDSRYLQGGQPIFGAMNADYKFGYFTGDALARTIESPLAPSDPSLLISWAMPIDDSLGGTLELGVRTQMSDDTTWKTGVAKVSSGRVPLRGRGHYVGFRRNIPAAATGQLAQGVDYVKASRGGR